MGGIRHVYSFLKDVFTDVLILEPSSIWMFKLIWLGFKQLIFLKLIESAFGEYKFRTSKFENHGFIIFTDRFFLLFLQVQWHWLQQVFLYQFSTWYRSYLICPFLALLLPLLLKTSQRIQLRICQQVKESNYPQCLQLYF